MTNLPIKQQAPRRGEGSERDRRKRIGTYDSLLNQANAALAAASPTIHAPDDVFRTGRSQAARDAGLNVIDDGCCILVLIARENQG
ncbi:MAG: hypothetical protein MUC43_11915 [Pirellula sp.]|nr:hypothetical protein [Pirellula sp.]